MFDKPVLTEKEKACLIDSALNCKLKTPIYKRLCKTTHTFKEALEIMMEAVKLGTVFWVLLICLAVVCSKIHLILDLVS